MYARRNFFGSRPSPNAACWRLAVARAQSRTKPEFPMPLTPDDVSRIAHLARLELSPAEGSAMQSSLNDFFKIVEQMSAVDTSRLEPLNTPLSAIRNGQ